MNIFRLLGDVSHLLAIIILLQKIWKTRSCAGSDSEEEPEENNCEEDEKKTLAEGGITDVVWIVSTSNPKCKEPIVGLDIEGRTDSSKPKRRSPGISGKSQVLFAIVYTARYLDLFTTYISAYNTIMKVFFLAASYGTIYLMYVKFKATYDHNHDTFRIEFLILPAAALALLINHAFDVLEILWTFSIYLESVAILPQLFLVSKTGEAESITSHYLFALGSYRALYLLNWIYRYYAEDHYDLIAIVAGIVQTVLYCDFFYLYITKVLKGKKLQLPA